MDEPLKLTLLSITVIRFTQDGMPVKSIDVPEVDATAVPLTILEFNPLTVTVPDPLGNVIVFVPATAGTAKETVPEVVPFNGNGVVTPVTFNVVAFNVVAVKVVADNVVNAPVFGVPVPIAPGEPNELLIKFVKPVPEAVPVQTIDAAVIVGDTKTPL